MCDRLVAGRTSVIVRKGGIHERRGVFRPEHDRFWLMATRFHQSPDDLRPGFRDPPPDPPPPGVVRLPGVCEVTGVRHLTDESELPSLAGSTPLAEHVLRDRFRYRTPGLWVLDVRVWVPDEPVELPDRPAFGGCRSWVDLGGEPAVRDARLRSRPRAVGVEG